MNARELVHVMNELTYGRGSRIPELRAMGESLFAQCERSCRFWLSVSRRPIVSRTHSARGRYSCLRRKQLLQFLLHRRMQKG